MRSRATGGLPMRIFLLAAAMAAVLAFAPISAGAGSSGRVVATAQTVAQKGEIRYPRTTRLRETWIARPKKSEPRKFIWLGVGY